MKVAISELFHTPQVAEVLKNYPVFEPIVLPKSADLRELPQDVEVFAGLRGVEKLDLNEYPQLKYIFLQSVGIDYLDLATIEKLGITLTNNNGAYSEPIGEWIVMNLLNMVKQTQTFMRQQRDKIWQHNTSVRLLKGKTILFLGTGTIAQVAAKLLAPFGAELVGYNTRGREVAGFDWVVSPEKLDEAYGRADFVVAVLPLTPATRNFLDQGAFRKMKDGVGIVNISRGPIIDEEALVAALKSKKVSAAALDVFVKEPLGAESPLWEMDGVYISPHNSFQADHIQQLNTRTIVKNLEHLAKGEALENVINFDKGY
ncbi:MAG: NAD(P)-dependent oxidoreductase [Tissierellia bacterium]|nr:NAD(P)-dependent oxidoreductase [Tissierellia bacterium]